MAKNPLSKRVKLWSEDQDEESAKLLNNPFDLTDPLNHLRGRNTGLSQFEKLPRELVWMIIEYAHEKAADLRLMRSVALVMLLLGAVAAAIHEFESDFPRPDDLFLYTIERSRREEAATSTTTTTTTTTEATTTTTAVLSTTPVPSTTMTTLAPVTAETTALPIIATSPLAPVTVTALNLLPQPALSLPAGAALSGYPSGLQLNHLGWAGQPYQLGLQSFPTGGYRFQHALIAPGAPSALARNYAPAVHFRPPAPLAAPLAPQFGAPYYGAVRFGAWQGRR